MKNIKIATKLALGFGIVSLLMVAMALVAVLSLERVSDKVELAVNDRYPKVQLVGDIAKQLGFQARLTRNVLIMDAKDRPGQLAEIAT